MKRTPTPEQKSQASTAIGEINQALLTFREPATNPAEEAQRAEDAARPIVDRHIDLFRDLACGEIQAERGPASEDALDLAVALATPLSGINALHILGTWLALFQDAARA